MNTAFLRIFGSIAKQVQNDLLNPHAVPGDSSRNRNNGGSGLGLAISKRLIELMGGALWVKSVLGDTVMHHFNGLYTAAGRLDTHLEFVFTVRQEVIDARPCIDTDPQIVKQPAVKKENQAAHLRSVLSMIRISMGLATKSFMPASTNSSLAPRTAFADKAMIGILRNRSPGSPWKALM